MQYKLLALDMDGTLLNSEKQITPKTLEALERLQQSGIRLILASGRPTPGVERFARQLRLREHGGYLLTFNGGHIVEAATGRVLYDRLLPQERLPDLVAAAREYRTALMTYEGRDVITEQPEDRYICYEAKINGLPVRGIDSFCDYVTFPLNKCLMTADGDELARVEVRMRERFPDLDIYRSEPFFMEIMPKGVDKATGLSRLLEQLGYRREELIGCGDGFNDESMVRFAGLGVAMGNAQQPVRDAADLVTRSNDEDGIAFLISEYLGV